MSNRRSLTSLQSLVQLFHAVGRARLAVDALGVEAVHLHVFQHHLQHHGDRVLIADQVTHPHTKVQTGRLLVTLWIQTDRQSIRSLLIQPTHHYLSIYNMQGNRTFFTAMNLPSDVGI